MAAVAAKKYTGQSGEVQTASSRREEVYVVTAATDVVDAITAAVAEATTLGEDTITVDGETLYRTGVGHEFVGESADGDIYEVTIRYGPRGAFGTSPEGTVRVNYDTTGGTVNRMWAISEVSFKDGGRTGTKPVFNNAINATSDGVDGVDIVVPQFAFTVTKVFEAVGLPDPADLFSLTGTTNMAVFTVTDSYTGQAYTFQAGEAVFEGARQGDPRPDGKVEVHYQFHASPNVTGETVAGIGGVNKKGSDYLWVRYAMTTDGSGDMKSVVPLPLLVVVNKVYPDGNWTGLGL